MHTVLLKIFKNGKINVFIIAEWLKELTQQLTKVPVSLLYISLVVDTVSQQYYECLRIISTNTLPF